MGDCYQVQCGELEGQCWVTQTFSNIDRFSQPQSLVEYSTGGPSNWPEMANGGRGYGGNVMLMRSESSTDSLVAMLASCSPVALQVQRSVGSLEDAVVGCGQKRSFYPSFETSGEEAGDDDGGDDCTHNVEKKRRLTFDQVRSLEKNFEQENKLEPERKMQLAKELGLQPRQVAVWFQNRRARWKTKQLERDYEVLTLDYNRLKSVYDAVVQEKQELQEEIECLTGKKPAPVPGLEEPLETSKSETASQLSSQKPSEESVKSEKALELTSIKDGLSAQDEKAPRTTSSESTSSELLDADSPRTVDSSLPLLPIDSITTCPQIPTDIMESSMLHMTDHLCDRVLPTQACQPIAVKLEEGSFQEDSCNYLLPQLDEQGAIPWWDWP